jgi:hypothetical protein
MFPSVAVTPDPAIRSSAASPEVQHSVKPEWGGPITKPLCCPSLVQAAGWVAKKLVATGYPAEQAVMVPRARVPQGQGKLAEATPARRPRLQPTNVQSRSAWHHTATSSTMRKVRRG